MVGFLLSHPREGLPREVAILDEMMELSTQPDNS